MIGAIMGDIVGSRFEWDNIKSKEFELFDAKCFPTDDSIMTLAVANAILKFSPKEDNLPELAVKFMRELGTAHYDAGYGGHFRQWLKCSDPQPYNSFGNGSAMRVSPCGFAAGTLVEAKHLAYDVSRVTHNHWEGIKGAEATAAAIFLARAGWSKAEIRLCIDQNYYPMNFMLDEIRPSYKFDETCQGSVPQALEAFFESRDFEDAIRNAISIGGDSDTIAAITGGVAEAYYGVPRWIYDEAMTFLDAEQRRILDKFHEKYPPKITD